MINWILGFINHGGDVEVVGTYGSRTAANLAMATRGDRPWRLFQLDEEAVAALLHCGERLRFVHGCVLPNVWEVL